MKILLTGATGFLGSALALYWRKAGHEVSLLLRTTSTTKRLLGTDDDFIIGRDATSRGIAAFIKTNNPEVVIHTACTYGRQGETKGQILETNVQLGVAILETLTELKQPVSFINTGSALPPEVSDYALSKYQFSQWGRLFAAESKGTLQFINVLLHQIYGPGDDPSKFAMHVLNACYRNNSELKLTAGEQMRDCIYIDDVVAAYDALLTQRHKIKADENIEVGTGTAPSIRQFVETIHNLTKSRTKLLFGVIPYRPNEAMQCKANIKRMNQLGWTPRFDIRKGLQKTIEVQFNV